MTSPERERQSLAPYTQTAISDNQGAYRLPDVPLNDYTLTIEAPGFETTTRDIRGSAPGWTEDANGRLHARGLEAQIQYSIDGIPVIDTIADIFASAAGSATERFLDPPTIANFHNRGSGIKSFVKLDYEPDEKNLFRLSLFANQQRFDVPNLLEQEISGQDQRRRGHDTMLSLTLSFK